MKDSKFQNKSKFKNSDGFSLIELIMVLLIITIMSGTVFYYLNEAKDLYKADEQALKIVDVIQEARQRSLTQRETMRVEIDLTAKVVRLIDENKTDTANDDEEIRIIPLKEESEVRVDEKPAQILDNPPEEFPVPSAQYRQSIYPASLLHDVCTMRFLSDGTVVDQGNNEIGANAIVTGLTLHVWSPNKENISNSKIARAITVIGSTGSVRLWEYDENLSGSVKWKDTRRTSIFGGQTGGS